MTVVNPNCLDWLFEENYSLGIHSIIEENEGASEAAINGCSHKKAMLEMRYYFYFLFTQRYGNHCWKIKEYAQPDWVIEAHKWPTESKTQVR
jgi:hypothetical protein